MEQLVNFVTGLFSDQEIIVEYFKAFGALVLAAKGFTILTPTKVDDEAVAGLGKVYNFIAKLLNVAALNVLKDKNADG